VAESLLRNGFELTAYDKRKEPLQELAEKGAEIAASSREVGEKADQAIIMVEQRGIDIVDCPVSGSIVRAREGTLNLMVGAKKEIFDECQPLFRAFGRDIFHVGEQVGMGQVAKACQLALSGVCSSTIGQRLRCPTFHGGHGPGDGGAGQEHRT
jgi:3-hydroxyisobutyrate dehydrogenase-like beta-hydroxyacid dehydrogenase